MEVWNLHNPFLFTLNSYTHSALPLSTGVPPRLNVTSLSIAIRDFNDHQPIFQGASYSLTIPEEVTGPLLLLNVTALDGDTGSNGQISYSLTAETDTFTIDPNTVRLHHAFVSPTLPLRSINHLSLGWHLFTGWCDP